jgi:CRISPR-associated protein Cas1
MELVLNSYGTALVKENGNLVVVHKDGRQIVPLDKLKTILISKGARLSSDAALLAIENEIEILFVDDLGKPQGRLWSIKYGSVSTIRRKQLDFTLSPFAVEWIKEMLLQKFDNQVALLLSISPLQWEYAHQLEKAINRINDYKTKVKSLKSEIISDIAPTLRGWEGAASRNYFNIISLLLPNEYHFDSRSQHPATDVFNCVLNYGYGILYGKVEGALIKAGLDPYVGVMHREDYNRPVLVFDVIEKFRVWIDYVVFKLLEQKAINEDCYSVKSDGSYWLESLGKRILIQSVNDYFDEIVKIDGVNRSRGNHIGLFATKFASYILKLKIR